MQKTYGQGNMLTSFKEKLATSLAEIEKKMSKDDNKYEETLDREVKPLSQKLEAVIQVLKVSQMIDEIDEKDRETISLVGLKDDRFGECKLEPGMANGQKCPVSFD